MLKRYTTNMSGGRHKTRKLIFIFFLERGLARFLRAAKTLLRHQSLLRAAQTWPGARRQLAELTNESTALIKASLQSGNELSNDTPFGRVVRYNSKVK